MFAIQEVGVLHDFFSPMDIAIINNHDGPNEWFQINIGDSNYLNFSTIFYKKRMVNDANNDHNVTIRILDEENTVVLNETTIKPGRDLSLRFLKYNKNYIVQVKCKNGRYHLNFV